MTKFKVIKDQVVLYEDQVLFIESVSSTLDEAIQQVKQYLEHSDSHITFDSFMTEIRSSTFEYSKCFLHLTSQSERDKESFHCPLIVTIDDEFLIYDRDQIIQELQRIVDYQKSINLTIDDITHKYFVDSLNFMLTN